MSYKIVKRLISRGKVVGYQLVDRDCKLCNLGKEKVYELASKGVISNAWYHERLKALKGYGIDLRSLENIKIEDNNSSNKDKVVKGVVRGRGKSNHKLGKEYAEKLRLLGMELDIKYKYMGNDRVKLIEVRKNLNRVEIPSFITDIEPRIFSGSNVTEVIIDNSGKRSFSCRGLFEGMKVSSIKLEFKHSECIVDMKGMFCWSQNLRYVDLRGIDTRNVKDMSYMFAGCTGLQVVDMGGLDLRKVENMSNMFRGCISLEEVKVDGCKKTESLMNMNSIYWLCKNIGKIDASIYNTSKVKDMGAAFYCCMNLRDIDVGIWDVKKVEDMNEIFSGCGKLREIDISKWDMGNVLDLSGAFYGCKSLGSIGVDMLEVNNNCNIDNVFYGCDELVVNEELKLKVKGGSGSLIDDNRLTF